MVYTFLDTCILDELIRIPSFTDPVKSEQIHKEFKERRNRKEKLILPYSVMIEAGNHIAQIKNDTERLRCAKQFIEFLDMSYNQKSPWLLCTDGLDKSQIDFISRHFQEIAMDLESGTGDISIIYQYKVFSERLGDIAEDIQIWSLDHHIVSLIAKLGLQKQRHKVQRRRNS